MSRIPTAPIRPFPAVAQRAKPAPVSRPTWLDYLFMLSGCGLSLFLAEVSGLRASGGEILPPALGQPLLNVLPALLLLPVGIILLWPLFYATQLVMGRPQHMTIGEWLWGVAWLLALALTAWIAWKFWGSPPEMLVSAAIKKHVIVGYILAVLSLGGIALLLALVDLIGRWPQPWTHVFGLALLLWPALPLAALWAWEIRLVFFDQGPFTP
jgi:hypothetical protein